MPCSRTCSAGTQNRQGRERGYDGQVSILKDFLRTLLPALAAAPVLRYETAPGEQMQVDWAVFRRGPDARLSAFVATLGYTSMQT